MPYHVDRSKLFVMDRVSKIKSLDATRIANAIESTRFPSADGADDSDSEEAYTIFGLIYLEARLGRKTFTEDDLRLLTSLANVAAIKIQNSRLQEESLAKQRIERVLVMDTFAADIRCTCPTVSFVPDPVRGVAEMARVVCPGGTVTVRVGHVWRWLSLRGVAG